MDFRYDAKTADGQRIQGTLEAESEAAALRQLDERSLFPVAVVAEKERPASSGSLRVRSRDLGVFYGQLADLLGSGVPLLRAIQSITRANEGTRIAAVLREVHDEIAEGKSLTKALGDRPESFPLLHVAMIQAGERASFLEEVLESLSSFVDRLDELRAKVRGALIYPALLCVVGSAVMIAALVFFVPKFAPLLGDVEKPMPTVVIFTLSDVLRNHGLAVAAVAVVSIVALFSALRSPVGRRVFDTWKLRVPVVGAALRMVAISRFCRILGTMLQNGVPMQQPGSTLLAAQIDEAVESVRGGATLSAPLEAGGLFPPQVLAMITVAEESNQLQKVLVDIADKVERRTHRRVDQAVRLLEPLILCVVAIAIGFLALGLLLPIFTLAGSLGQ